MTFDFATVPGDTNPSHLSGRLSWDRGGHCIGHIALAGKGTADLIVSGSTTWLKPDTAFARAQYGPAAAAALSGKYLIGPTTDPHFAAVTSTSNGRQEDLCQRGVYIQSIPDELDDQATKLGTYVTDGVRTVGVETEGKASAGDVYIAAEGTTYLVKSVPASGTGPTMLFSGYGKPVAFVAPKKADTLDVSELPTR